MGSEQYEQGTKMGANRVIRRRSPPVGARCARCGSDNVAGLPTFALGAGVAYRPVADDVYCRSCGYIDQPVLESVDTNPERAE